MRLSRPKFSLAFVFAATVALTVGSRLVEAQTRRRAGAPTKKPAPTSPSTAGPSKAAAELLGGFEDGDFKKIFDNSFVYQAELGRLRAQNPQVMWPQVTTQYFESKRSEFIKPPQRNLFSIAQPFTYAQDPKETALTDLLKPKPSWKILETRSLQPEMDMSGTRRAFSAVYVQLNYKDMSAAPVFGEGLLKQTIVSLKFESDHALFWSAEVIANSDAKWQMDRPRITSAQWVTTLRGSLNIGYNILGGAPPYSSTTRCGSYQLENMGGVAPDPSGRVLGSPLEIPRSHINIYIQYTELPNNQFPLSCSLVVRDANGHEDTATFVVPRMYAEPWGGFCFVRHPWFEWGQAIPRPRAGCTQLAELADAPVSP
ncbi:MAG TPA: hypothetical protein VE863_12335 [Pyrinomonadaceae bacterium]|jgi:hypothetical protein|nr:hypothetical protein [Pyrinomonadaceae bacterium]